MVKKWQFAAACLIAGLIAIIGHPLWLATVTYAAWMPWLYWSLGIVMLATAAGLSVIDRFRFFQYLFGVWGGIWFILWFYQCFPAFSISLI